VHNEAETVSILTSGDPISDRRLSRTHDANEIQIGTTQPRTKKSGGINLHAFFFSLDQIGILKGIIHTLVKGFARVFPFETSKKITWVRETSSGKYGSISYKLHENSPCRDPGRRGPSRKDGEGFHMRAE
jgi:hypothetical protein